MDKELSAILEKLDSEIFTDDLKTSLATVFENAVAQRVQDRVDLELKQMDESHAEKTSILIERMESTFNDFRNQVDEDHCNKMLTIKNKLEESYGKKLMMVKEAYEKVLKEQAIKHRDQLVNAIDLHLNTYLEKAIPTKQVEEAAKNVYVQKQLDEARKVLGIDKSMISENFKKAVLDGKSQMDKVLKEKNDLKKAFMFSESKRVLAESTQNLPIEQAKFVRSKLEGKSADFIKANLKYVLEMFDRTERDKKTSLLSENKPVIIDRATVVKTAGETNNNVELHTENVNNPENPFLGMYMEGMKFKK